MVRTLLNLLYYLEISKRLYKEHFKYLQAEASVRVSYIRKWTKNYELTADLDVRTVIFNFYIDRYLIFIFT